ncbi:uncharacterized protein B0H18DRAFT_1041495 [Fomitopsis serialis]|uniref:uncharacterized protein n=1 Tax=Fomitopsis serialis TaxID=139415 RepID=UPI002008C03C|nr:uncharacterized protein B0H18DRAFT_1041495 [Neoantrodia serialis]KAH9915494.1 hypothetical protein B0H18DRAFT_1041495 [Neoantrodia serialis]
MLLHRSALHSLLTRNLLSQYWSALALPLWLLTYLHRCGATNMTSLRLQLATGPSIQSPRASRLRVSCGPRTSMHPSA